jgi:hypothetical protein
MAGSAATPRLGVAFEPPLFFLFFLFLKNKNKIKKAIIF